MMMGGTSLALFLNSLRSLSALSFHAGAAPLQQPVAPVLTAADFDAEIQSGLLDVEPEAMIVEGEDDAAE
jgi:hypothetical protein